MRKTILAAGAAAVLALSTAAALAKSDKEFIQDALMGDNAEVAVAQLAMQRATNPQVKQFAQQLMTDHGQHRTQVIQIAQQLGVQASDEVKAEDKKTMTQLQGLQGAQFDTAFVRAMITDHRKAISEYTAQAKAGGQTAQLAQQTLPVLQQHLQTAESLQKLP